MGGVKRGDAALAGSCKVHVIGTSSIDVNTVASVCQCLGVGAAGTSGSLIGYLARICGGYIFA